MDGIRRGFRIGFNHGKCTCNEIHGRQYGISGVLSIICVADYLATELRAGHVVRSQWNVYLLFRYHGSESFPRLVSRASGN